VPLGVSGKRYPRLPGHWRVIAPGERVGGPLLEYQLPPTKTPTPSSFLQFAFFIDCSRFCTVYHPTNKYDTTKDIPWHQELPRVMETLHTLSDEEHKQGSGRIHVPDKLQTVMANHPNHHPVPQPLHQPTSQQAVVWNQNPASLNIACPPE